MKKTATMNLRVDPMIKEQAEEILRRLGIPMATAIDMYLNQIAMVGGIPFSVTLPQAPESMNADMMTQDEIHKKLQKGLRDAEEGRMHNAEEVFARFGGKV